MKIYSLIATTAIAALALAGCNKETAAPATDPDAGTKTITLSIAGANLTKAAATPSEGWAEAAAINQLDIYFTTASGAIQNVYRFSAAENTEAWNAINAKQGVRFIGIDNVSRVYVVANSPVDEYTTGNISQVTATLDKLLPQGENTDILYFGADEDITPILDEEAENVGATIGNPEDQASQYYEAVISVRPVISRLEINKISVVTKGSVVKNLNVTGTEKAYTIAWEGFTPKLTGIYMSNFYGKITPVSYTLADEFATPAGNKIENGAWAVDSGIPSAYNLPALAYYSNYDSGYQDLFGTDATAEGETKQVYFDGANATCVPFNFIVPFDPKETDPVIGIPTSVTFNTPRFHFQFLFDNQDAYNVTVTTADGPVAEGTDEYLAVTADINFTTVSDDIYFANVVKFMKDASNEQTIAPNTIYKMSEVEINPFNLTTGTVGEDSYNVVVRVTPIDYNPINVLPGFDKE